MAPPRLYDDLADWWPLLSPLADVAAEAGFVDSLVTEQLGTPFANRQWLMIELGAGAGQLLWHLQDRFNCTAVDVSEAMLRQCRHLNPRVPAVVADMRSVRLRRTYDVVLSHDAMDYLVSVEDLRSACASAAAHLKPGGLFLAGPTYVSETFVNHDFASDVNCHGDRKVRYVSYVTRDHGEAAYELVHLILVLENGKLQIEEDRHRCGLFDRETWMTVLTESGFEVTSALNINEGQPDHDIPHCVFIARSNH